MSDHYMNKRSTLLNIVNLSKSYMPNGLGFKKNRGNEIKAVDHINLRIYESESLGIVGESGSGKSTLGRCLIRLEEPDKGKIIYRDMDLLHLSSRQYREYRESLQMIFQNPDLSLNPLHSVKKTVIEPLKVIHKMNSRSARKRTLELLHSVGLEASHLKRLPNELSGGQKQRVSIARALAASPSLIIADEPTSRLDAVNKFQIVDLLLNLRKQLGLSLLIISHDISIIKYATERVAVMLRGKIIESGLTKNVVSRPMHPYTKQMIDLAKHNFQTFSANESKSRQIQNGTSEGCAFKDDCPYAENKCYSSIPDLLEKFYERWVACHKTEKIIEQTEYRTVAEQG
jgi:oligopeptide/dipeptide ABC transporter ATP-binding protein